MLSLSNVKDGQSVEIYYNLHKKCFSVRDRKTRRVIAHTDSISLLKATFHVSEKGRDRVRREKRKNVHAFVRGTYKKLGWSTNSQWFKVKYNPYEYDRFYSEDLNNYVDEAYCVHLDNKTILANGIM
tara:strand:- start:503 stop:883 length:381 start_codon:yes stop_codon:yes gene_type:complete